MTMTEERGDKGKLIPKAFLGTSSFLCQSLSLNPKTRRTDLQNIINWRSNAPEKSFSSLALLEDFTSRRDKKHKDLSW